MANAPTARSWPLQQRSRWELQDQILEMERQAPKLRSIPNCRSHTVRLQIPVGVLVEPIAVAVAPADRDRS